MAELTPRQARFVEEYLIDLNATQAAIRAGFSPRTADQIGYQLLHKTSVAEAVSRAQAERSARIGLHADRVLEELASIGFAKLGDYATWAPGRFELKPSHDTDANGDEVEAVDTRAVVEVKIKTTTITTDDGDEITKVEQGIKLHDKISTLKLLGQHIGMFPDRKEIGNVPGETFTVDVKPRDYRDGLGSFLPPADGEDDGS